MKLTRKAAWSLLTVAAAFIPLANGQIGHAQGTQSVNPSREVASIRGVSIVSLLRPDDTDVTVVRGGIEVEPYVGTPLFDRTASEELARIAKDSDAVAVAKVSAVHSSFVEDGAWVRTRVEGLVQAIVKGGTPALVHWFNTLSFEADGGEMILNDRVLLKVGRYRRYTVGETYLGSVRDFVCEA